MPFSRADDVTRWKLQQTAALYLGYFSINFYLCLIGPSLLDLQITANTTTKAMTMMFIGRSIGGILGAALFAFVFAKLNRSLVLAGAFLVIAVVMTLLPWLGNVVAVSVVYGIGGTGYCIADAGSFTQVMRIWGNKHGPWLQAMYACFIVGCLLAPLLVKPFLVSNEKHTTQECYGGNGMNYLHSFSNNTLYIEHHNAEGVYTNETLSNTATQPTFPYAATFPEYPATRTDNPFVDLPESIETHIWKAYATAGVVLSVAAISHIVIYFMARHKRMPHGYAAPAIADTSGGHSRGALVRLLIAQMAVFVLVVCCLQRAQYSYLFAYAVHCHGWEKDSAALLKMAFQAGTLSSRLMGVVLLHHVTPQALLITASLASVAVFSALTLAGAHVPVMWMTVVVAGLTLAPIYGCGLSWGSQHFTVGGKVGAIFTLSGAFSDILSSLVINLLYDRYGLATFSYFSLILTISMTVGALFMFVTIRFINSNTEKYSPAALTIRESATVETDLANENNLL